MRAISLPRVWIIPKIAAETCQFWSHSEHQDRNYTGPSSVRHAKVSQEKGGEAVVKTPENLYPASSRSTIYLLSQSERIRQLNKIQIGGVHLK